MELTNDFRVSVPPPTAWQVLTDVERIAPMLPGAQLQEIEGDEYRGIVKVKVGPITAQYRGTATFAERDESAGRVVLKASGRDTRGQGNANATITATLSPDGDGTKVNVVTDLTVTGKVAQFGRGVLADVSSKLIGQFVDALEQDLSSSPATSAGTTPPVAEPEPPAAAAAAPAPSGAPPSVAGAAVAAAGAAATGATVEPTSVPPAQSPSSAPSPAAASSPTSAPAPSSSNGTLLAAETPSAPPSSSGGGPSAEAPSVRKVDSPEPEPVDLIGAAGGSVAKRLLPVAAILGVLAAVALAIRAARSR